jgi:hypothetical protein
MQNEPGLVERIVEERDRHAADVLFHILVQVGTAAASPIGPPALATPVGGAEEQRSRIISTSLNSRQKG